MCLKEFWPSRKKNRAGIREINGKTDPVGIATEINSYFANIGANLAEKIGHKEQVVLPTDPPIFS